MAGIYVHIPFCRQACHYCNFHFSTNLSTVDPIVSTIIKELELREVFLKSQLIETIYFGGGTPSILSIEQLKSILKAIEEYYNLANSIETTIELNPEDVSIEYAKQLLDIGFNRVSIGIQSFEEGDLKFMNRSHHSGQSHDSLVNLNKAGFNNISLDLMFGLIGSDLNKWEKNIELALEYNPQHLSCYNLTIEEQTAFGKWEKEGRLRTTDESIQFDQFIFCNDLLTKNGYDHYEISNYSRLGYQSKHNTNYWNRVPYLGIGPGAHSFKQGLREFNISNNAKYIKEIADNTERQQDLLTSYDLFNELIMLGLRTKSGISKELISKFAQPLQSQFEKSITKLLNTQAVHQNESFYFLKTENWYRSDFISSELFVISE